MNQKFMILSFLKKENKVMILTISKLSFENWKIKIVNQIICKIIIKSIFKPVLLLIIIGIPNKSQ